MKMSPMEYVQYLTYPKTGAILNKIVIYFLLKVVKNATGFYQIN